MGRGHHPADDNGSDEYCLVFVHIPKTAGSTLSTALALNYPPHQTIRVDLINGPASEIEDRIPLEERARARLVRGHLPYGVHRHIPRHCEYITVLREPIARDISDYKFILRNPAAFRTHLLHDPEVGRKIGLEGYLERAEGADRRGNRQTRLLTGRYEGHLGRESLEEAKRNLERFLVVGLTERFEETFVLVRRTLRLRVPLYITRLVAPSLKVSDRVVELIRRQNQLDLELYAFGRRLFSEQVASQGKSFALEAAIFRGLRPLSRAAGKGRTEEYLVKLSRIRDRRRIRGSS